MSRREFSRKIMAAAALRASGHCEICTCRLREGGFHYDHRIPDALGGEPTLDNCQVLCRSCHGSKTTKRDIPTISKSKRNFNKAHGIKKPRSLRSWRRFSGEIVYATRER
jgi:5-methylcytosine-specific restriction protein A